MPQSSCKYFKVQGRNVNLHLRIELVGGANRSSEELAGISELNVDDGDSSVCDDESPLLPVISEGKADSTTELKERLHLIEKNCLGLERLYQKYRLRWLEEKYRVGVLEEYAPHGISTCSPRQIPWDAPSPPRSRKTYCKLGFCMSPIAHVDNVRAPVLLLIGEDDLRAVPAQGLRFYDALKGREKRVEMLWFKGRHIRLMVLRRQGFRGRLGGIGLRI
ncbi:uncharacterized protein F5891DRAFT_1225181 [Suillus fuscotomentosus]|uniref:Dipeptidyl-peptidase V n=1 Tax=Suillus fuscotomentosus TaxID=1912939 RepID=A0AAD4E7I4_9AGAM|nr:uncharacterized protein F5891DRAFT_1225181 [Suillus fuscotomentosus]KAG1900736.1 hypothetical protein F5891DRAFT_1225181 [Suillus fuscotomentosus]